MNKEFLSTLTILYLEDDSETNKNMTDTMSSIFNKVYSGLDGKIGLELFKSHQDEIDLIVSDINMPFLTGIEMLKQIREFDKNIPVIFATAYAESSFMLDAIKLNTSGYVVKPYQIKELFSKIEQICFEMQSVTLAIRQKKELDVYLSMVNQVAIISKTDLDGNIIYVNDIFCDISGYTMDELLGKPHNIIRHPDMSSATFKDMWETIKQGNIWRGKLKNKAKNGEAYYVNTSIMPIFKNEEIIEYIGIRFLTTQEENEKRDFKKQVINNIQDFRKKEASYKNEILELTQELNRFKHFEFIADMLDQEKKRTSKFHSQILFYEDKIDEYNKQIELLKYENKEKLDKSYEAIKRLYKDKKRLESNYVTLEQKISNDKAQDSKYKDIIQYQDRRIKELEDIINHMRKNV